MVKLVSSDIRTTGNGQQAVVIPSGEDSVVNVARITTLGDRADGIVGVGNRQSVLNIGTVETRGGGAAGIKLTGTDSFVLNSGTVRVAGDTIFGSDPAVRPQFADAIDIIGDRFLILNLGKVSIAGSDSAGLAGTGNAGEVRNLGAIEASGDFALGMGVSGARGQARNDGTIRFDAFAGTAIYGFNGSGNRLYNQGRIEMAGDFSVGMILTGSLGYATNEGAMKLGGVGVYGLLAVADRAELRNSGTIAVQSRATAADGPIASAAIVALGDDARITNYNQISTQGVFAVGIQAGAGGASVTNIGVIETAGNYSSGIKLGAASPDMLTVDDGEIRNLGKIATKGDASVGILMLGDNNVLTNAGHISTAGNAGSEGVLGLLPAAGVVATGDAVRVTNAASGVIEARAGGGIGVMLNALEVGGESNAGATARFENYGKVTATTAVLGGDGADVVLNAGMLSGAVDLGAGDDRFVAAGGGRLSGLLTLGAGNDVVQIARGSGRLDIVDFMTGAGSDDRLDLTAFGFRNLRDVTAAAQQVGQDVFIRSGAGDTVVLHDVRLGMLHADDFIFTPSGVPIG